MCVYIYIYIYIYIWLGGWGPCRRGGTHGLGSAVKCGYTMLAYTILHYTTLYYTIILDPIT